MPCVDNFRSPYCSDVNIVNIVGLAVIIHTATVKMQVKGSRLGIPMQGSNKDLLWAKKGALQIEMHPIFGVYIFTDAFVQLRHRLELKA
jgi:hypothetical protein